MNDEIKMGYDETTHTSITVEIKEYLRKMASNGGKASARNMTPEQRKERARKAGLAKGKKLSTRKL